MERSISPSKRAGDDLNAIDNRHHQRARSGDTLVRNGQWHDNPPMRRRHSVAIPTLALGQNSRDESRHPTCAEPNFVITPTTTAPYTLAVGSYLQAPTVDRYFQVSATNSYFQPPVLGCQPPTVDRYFQAPAAGSYSQAPGLPTGYLSPDTCYWNVNAGSSSSIPEFSSGRASPNVSSSSPGSSPNANRRLSESSISQVLESMQVPSVQSTLEGLHIRVTQEEMSLDVQMDEEICYGMVIAQAQFIEPRENSNQNRKTEIEKLQILQLEVTLLDSGRYGLKSELGPEPYAVLDKSIAAMIEYLDRPEFASVRYQINQFSASENAFGSKSHQCGNENGFSIMVNIYGLRSVMEDVGKAMAKIKAYLQQPSRVDPGIQYENPHYFKTPGYDKTPWIESDIEQTEDKDEPSMCGILSKVLNSQLTRSNGLREIDPDPRIKTVLFRYQRQALDFISQRESGITVEAYSLWRVSEGSPLMYKNLISGAWQNHIPQEPRGGIIADEVGLGKTLTMISAIAGSMDEALQFQHFLDQWVDQIHLHTVEGSLTVHTYHGSSGKVRGTTPLRDYDVVLTTYATVSSDFSRRKEHSTLFAENWFRIVLDEAHQIRNNKSKQFRAISSLSAQRRWCLTATPIQNNLNDIAALFEYLQVEPIHTQALFKRHIVEPLKADDLRSDDVVSIRNLQLLLITYCLRRQQSLLPQFINENQDEMIQIVEFHADERQNYENLKLECNRAIKDAVCKKSGYGQAYFTVLQTILQLRLFCNHGLFLPAPGMLKSEFGLSNRCGHQACVSCSPKGPLDPETQCVDVENERRPSLQCEERPKEQDAREAVSKKSQRYSRKIGALLEDIQNNPTNEKSIVFSSWVRSLELVEEALKSQGIGCVRVDGKLDSKARKKILRRFREDPYVLVLLMTTGTGAVGLNLTAASRVHILEPQWNPMVEVQAIGRVARLGQRKRVTIYRYIMANTIEENVRIRQLMKKSLADVAIDMEKFQETRTRNYILQRLKDFQSIL